MILTDIIAQIFGILGLIFSVYSFQEKNNRRFFISQSLSGLMFCINFIMIGAVSATLFNVVNFIRGTLLSKNDHKLWRLLVLIGAYTACFVFSLTTMFDKPFQIFLSSLTYIGLITMSVFMWLGNGKHIRYVQFAISSPSWIVHNIFNFSLGGLLCEMFSMISVVVSFIRFGKDGFEN